MAIVEIRQNGALKLCVVVDGGRLNGHEERPLDTQDRLTVDKDTRPRFPFDPSGVTNITTHHLAEDKTT